MHAFSILVEKLTRFCDRVAAFVSLHHGGDVVNILLRALGEGRLWVRLTTSMFGDGFRSSGGGLLCLNNGQIAVEFFIDKFPVKAQAVIDIVSHLVALCFWGMVPGICWDMPGRFTDGIGINDLSDSAYP